MADEPTPKDIELVDQIPPFGEEPQKTVEETPQEKPQETEEKIKEEIKEEPVDETKKRTAEQFNKLKEHNQELKEKVRQYEDVLSSLQPKIPENPLEGIELPPIPQIPPEQVVYNPPPASQFPHLGEKGVKDIFEQLVDDEGAVDRDLLLETLRKQEERARIAEQKAKEAEEAVRRAERKFDDFQRKAIMREVHAKYPQIDPESDQFNETMWVAVRNEIIGQWSETGVEDPMAAADKWYKILYGKKDKEDVEEKKAQINATISQAPRSPTTKDHSQKLRTGTLQDQAEVLEEMGY